MVLLNHSDDSTRNLTTMKNIISLKSHSELPLGPLPFLVSLPGLVFSCRAPSVTQVSVCMFLPLESLLST